MTTTAADWVKEVEQHLGVRPANKLSAAVTDTTTGSITLTYPMGNIADGALVGVDTEVMLVWATSGQGATVERGAAGSTAATHANGAMVYVLTSSNTSQFSILRALNQDLSSLGSAGLFHMAAVEVTYNPAKAGYDLAGVTSIEDVYKVEAKVTGLTGDWRVVRNYRMARDEDTGDFASGFSLRIGEGGQSGQSVRVFYRQPFVALAGLTTDVTTTLLPASAYDIPPIGAAARLVGPREVVRNNFTSQGNSRRAEEVPARAVASSANDLWAQWNRRVGQEINDLQRRYPQLTEALI